VRNITISLDDATYRVQEATLSMTILDPFRRDR